MKNKENRECQKAIKLFQSKILKKKQEQEIKEKEEKIWNELNRNSKILGCQDCEQ